MSRETMARAAAVGEEKMARRKQVEGRLMWLSCSPNPLLFFPLVLFSFFNLIIFSSLKNKSY